MSEVIENQEFIKDEFDTNKEKSIIELRKLVKENSEVSQFRTDDEYLLRFLYLVSFDVTEAVEKMAAFQKHMIKHSFYFTLTPPLEMQSIIEQNSMVLLDARDKGGRVIFFLRFANLDANNLPEDYSRLVDVILEYAFLKENAYENGMTFIVDVENFPLRFITWLTPKLIKLALRLIVMYPCKEYKAHVVNTSLLFDVGLKLVWPIVPAFLKKLVTFHFRNYSSLHEHINQEDLPNEYGGTGPDIDYDYYNKQLYDRNDELKEILEQRNAIFPDKNRDDEQTKL